MPPDDARTAALRREHERRPVRDGPDRQGGIRHDERPDDRALVNTGVQSLPYIKGGQTDVANYYGAGTVQAVNGTNDQGVSYQSELKWWYRTQGGAINYSPSGFALPPRPDLDRQRPDREGRLHLVGGRAYVLRRLGRSVGPEQQSGASRPTSTAARPLLTGFNNDYFFHNTMPAFNNGVADDQQGHVRPRWTYPNLYRTNTAGRCEQQGLGCGGHRDRDADHSSLGGVNCWPSRRALGPIQTAPVLMDFWWAGPRYGRSRRR